MLGRKPNKREQEWLNLCYQTTCMACKHFAEAPHTPGEYHHTRGKTDPDAHMDGFMLCERHHRIPDNFHPKRWISRHGDGRRLFELRYCTEREFLILQRAEVEELKKCQV